MKVGSPSLDGKREPEPRRSGVAEQLFAADSPSTIGEPNPSQARQTHAQIIQPLAEVGIK
jgi:hypothetical protein